jgi:hypothetical protein
MKYCATKEPKLAAYLMTRNLALSCEPTDGAWINLEVCAQLVQCHQRGILGYRKTR